MTYSNSASELAEKVALRTERYRVRGASLADVRDRLAMQEAN